ncbi:MAG TPA: hypothetical protein VJ483_03925 [Holophagaceae bacterium]|nr:hypothetical protein [Holophagaceae bacterium]
MPAPTHSTLLRTILGVILGAIAMGLLVGIIETWATANLHPSAENPTMPILIHLACNFLAAMGGGFVCAYVARNPRAATALAVLILLSALAYQAKAPDPNEPSWYRLALLLVGPVGVYSGGWLKGA